MHEDDPKFNEDSTKYSDSQCKMLQQLLGSHYQEEEGTGDEPNETMEECGSNSSKACSENGRDTQSPLGLNGDRTQEILNQLKFLGHQVVRLMQASNHKPCMCGSCVVQVRKIESDLKSGIPCASGSVDSMTSDNSGVRLSTISNGNHQEVEYYEDGTLKRGRKSKYCTAAEKIECAAYAEKHGAAAAARKFNIPAQVAAYYFRKLRKNKPGTAVFQSIASVQQTKPIKQGSLENDNNENFDMISEPSTPQLDINTSDLFPKMHLRGRGRGRPKLIGDELDAELVEYMVNVKRRIPRGHLSASYALEVARTYIVEKAPHILEENGGHVNLKMTWAIKLVSRTNERYRELFGEYDATLSSLAIGEQPPHSSAPAIEPTQSGNASMVDSSMEQQNEIVDYLKRFDDEYNPGAPEITNVRELDVYKLKQEPSFDNAMSGNIN